MPTIDGLFSGLDTTSIVNQLIEIEQRPIVSLQTRVGETTQEKVALLELSGRILALKTRAEKIGDTDFFGQTATSSSRADVLSASGNGVGTTGTFSFQPVQLARANQFLSNGFADRNTTSILGSGSFGGTIEITLYVSTDVKDTDFTVKLIDVYPDGKAYNLDETIQRARYREGYDKEVFMEEGNVYKIRVSPMSTSNYFGPGHRVRIEVSSSNFPRFARNLNTGGNNYDEAQGITAYNNVHHSEEFPSQIRLPIVEHVPNQSEQNGE